MPTSSDKPCCPIPTFIKQSPSETANKALSAALGPRAAELAPKKPVYGGK